MGRPTILTCAVTGNITRRDQHPGLPVTPKEIAEAAIAAGKAGAAIAHIHARDPETGKGTREVKYFDEIVDRIRQSGSDIILNLTTGEGGRYVPGADDPAVAGEGTTLVHPALRIAHVIKHRPEICTLDLNTMFSGSAVVINTPDNVELMANAILAAGVKPELELFDSGDVALAKVLIKKGVLPSKPMIQLVLGVRYGAQADPATLFFLQSQLPEGSIWAAFGIGRASYPMLAQAWLLGGHVRIGMEDTLHISAGKLTRDNAQLVEKGVSLVENLGGTIVTPDEARQILDLPARHPAL
ncbi:3-keto-5-aminohexanoate cleavage protein [Sphingobium subterraneum]|uniref:Uncharacterized protein (DUF849 family) n=1 Tax=Sphingobium subterraneum TaxID=627688 RepID=A0A841IZ58_9SPHN|nr:3-keto-5-aminohexanoate cleavage protein [Sphingobium subterraneum]MBB6123412.1 uncharacterized protein (DUF849 family) [Sphingobium subterraneum]